jgi:excisionase family DNA binding protein
LGSSGEVAALLNVSPDTIRRYAREGRIPVFFVTPGGHYRFDLEAVLDVLRPPPPE